MQPICKALMKYGGQELNLLHVARSINERLIEVNFHSLDKYQVVRDYFMHRPSIRVYAVCSFVCQGKSL